MNDSKFIRTFLITFFAVLILIAAANYVIDPYGMHFHSRYEGFNKNKPAFMSHSRVIKLYNSKAIKPDAIFLGNSRILYLTPEEAFRQYKPYSYYNFALSGGTINEMNDMLAYAIRNFNIDYVCYGIDFVALLSRSVRYANAFDTALVNGQKSIFIEYLKLHTSIQAIDESYACVSSNMLDPEGRKVRWHYNKYGSRTNKWRELNYEHLGERWIDSEMKTVLENYDWIYNNRRFILPDYKKAVYLQILEQCNQNHTDYTAFINPLYKDHFSLLLRSSAYPLYIEFLKFLANNGGVWYFGGINEITSNREYFWDTQHPRKKMSEIISKVMFSETAPAYTDKLFGTFVNPENIDQVVFELDKLRKDLKAQIEHGIQE